MSRRDLAVWVAMIVALEIPLILAISLFLTLVLGINNVISVFIAAVVSGIAVMPISLMWMHSRRR